MVKIFLSISVLAALIGCSKPDTAKPHEYIKAVGYSEGWGSTEDNNYRLHLTQIKIYSELGSGKCEKYLNELDAERVYLAMVATNALIHSEYEGRHDIPIKYAKLQCIAYHGQDQACEKKRIDLSKKIDANTGRKDATAFFLSTMGDCDIKKEIGPVRTFSLDDSKKYRYVPN
jgi:hypothetical protein